MTIFISAQVIRAAWCSTAKNCGIRYPYRDNGIVPPQEEELSIDEPDFEDMNNEEVRKIHAMISGTCVERLRGDPENFEHDRVNDLPGLVGFGGLGAKPTGMISANGTLYLAVQNLLGDKPTPEGPGVSQVGADASIICSKDFGKTWEPDIETPLRKFYDDYADYKNWRFKIPPEERFAKSEFKPMFPDHLFGGPAFIQFGKDNADALDDYVYAVSGEQWDNGNHLRLGRVPNDKILDRAAWEFAIPHDDGSVSWTKDLLHCKPILSITKHIGTPEMVYIPKIKKYILITWGYHTDMQPNDGAELTVLESDNPWGPFHLVYYEWMWYKQEFGGYCPRIPMKWFDEETLSGYMLQAGNFLSPAPREYYKPLIRGFKFITAK